MKGKILLIFAIAALVFLSGCCCPITPVCEEGWKCKDSNTKAYQNSDCLWEQETVCELGCSDGNCVEVGDLCQGVECNDYCVESTRFYNGNCVDGECTYSSMQCQYGCENGLCEGDLCADVNCPDYCLGTTRFYNGTCAEGECTYTSLQCPYGCENGLCEGDPCTGVECPDYCSGNTRFYNGACVDGDCTYSSLQCQYGCSNGLCIGDPCAGVTCQDVCDGKTRKYNGSCVDGDCVYSTEECDYDCEDAECVEDPCEGVTCPDYCDNDTLYNDGECVEGECEYTITGCGVDEPYCEDEMNLRTGGYCENAECHYEGLGCICGCENGACLDPAELCAGVTCYDYCEDGIFYYDGYCNCGECVYSEEECVFGCEDEWGCIPETDAMMFITSGRWTGDLGGIFGADEKCEIAAADAGLPLGWIALISDSFWDIRDRPEFPDTIFRRMDGSIVAMSKADLFDGSINVPINIDEYGVVHTEVGQAGATWTGTKPDGTVFTGTYGGILVTNCEDWTNGTDDYYNRGIGGDIQETNNYWIDDHPVSNVLYCSNVQRLYCVHTS